MTAPDANNLDGYTPDCFVLAAIHRMQPLTGVAADDSWAIKHSVARAVIAEAEVLQGAPASDRQHAVVWPEGFLPGDYFTSLAARIAGPIWPQYTPQQQTRMLHYAAQYTIGVLVNAFPAERPTGGLSSEEYAALPYEVRRLLMERFHLLTEYRRRTAVFLAYLATHPDDEARAEDMHRLAEAVQDADVNRWFF